MSQSLKIPILLLPKHHIACLPWLHLHPLSTKIANCFDSIKMTRLSFSLHLTENPTLCAQTNWPLPRTLVGENCFVLCVMACTAHMNTSAAKMGKAASVVASSGQSHHQCSGTTSMFDIVSSFTSKFYTSSTSTDMDIKVLSPHETPHLSGDEQKTGDCDFNALDSPSANTLITLPLHFSLSLSLCIVICHCKAPTVLILWISPA